MADKKPSPVAGFIIIGIFALIGYGCVANALDGDDSDDFDAGQVVACQMAVEQNYAPVHVSFDGNPTKRNDVLRGTAQATLQGTEVSVSYYCAMSGDDVVDVQTSP